jgi:hypothetical protein
MERAAGRIGDFTPYELTTLPSGETRWKNFQWNSGDMATVGWMSKTGGCVATRPNVSKRWLTPSQTEQPAGYPTPTCTKHSPTAPPWACLPATSPTPPARAHLPSTPSATPACRSPATPSASPLPTAPCWRSSVPGSPASCDLAVPRVTSRGIPRTHATGIESVAAAGRSARLRPRTDPAPTTGATRTTPSLVVVID